MQDVKNSRGGAPKPVACGRTCWRRGKRGERRGGDGRRAVCRMPSGRPLPAKTHFCADVDLGGRRGSSIRFMAVSRVSRHSLSSYDPICDDDPKRLPRLPFMLCSLGISESVLLPSRSSSTLSSSLVERRTLLPTCSVSHSSVSASPLLLSLPCLSLHQSRPLSASATG